MSFFSKYCFLTVLTMVFITIASCSNDNCMGNSNAIPLAAFYQDDKAVNISGLTVYGIGAPNDSCIISNTAASQVYLPLRLDATRSSFVMEYNEEDVKNDTITLEYEAVPFFESHECGAMYNFNITAYEYTTNSIDSVAIPNLRISNADVASIKIYMQ